MKESFRRESSRLGVSTEPRRQDVSPVPVLGGDPRLTPQASAGAGGAARWQLEPWASAPWDEESLEECEPSDALNDWDDEDDVDFDNLPDREKQDLMLNFVREVLQTVSPKLAPAPPTWKAGRNDPCPCGSGKKFKRCHGQDSSP